MMRRKKSKSTQSEKSSQLQKIKGSSSAMRATRSRYTQLFALRVGTPPPPVALSG